MAHIWSDDVATGFTYDGTWNLQQTISGVLKLTYHHINDGNLPWIYPGVEVMIVQAAGGARTVTFPVIQTEKTDLGTATVIKTAIDLAMVPDGITVAVLYVAATDTFDLTFTAAVVINWSDGPSTSNLVWNEVGSGDTASSVNQQLDCRYVDPRPPTLELEIGETIGGVQSSRVTDAILFIPTADFQLRDTSFQVNGNTTVLTIAWSRINAPGISVPMTNQWELQFV